MIAVPINDHILVQLLQEESKLVTAKNYSKFTKVIVVDIPTTITSVAIGDTLLVEGPGLNDSCIDGFTSSKDMYLMHKNYIVAKLKD